MAKIEKPRIRAAAELGRLWDEGLSSGTVDGPTAMRRLRAKIEAMRRSRTKGGASRGRRKPT